MCCWCLMWGGEGEAAGAADASGEGDGEAADAADASGEGDGEAAGAADAIGAVHASGPWEGQGDAFGEEESPAEGLRLGRGLESSIGAWPW